ncbi:TIGR02680 family protein [Aquibacillus sp. 3ASR75-11]|uniref:TIGR02680 family protein n=1 Tax=Terrihalobacillus insolitus TaxID=2950438 RepID=A0A9X3WVI9_9BACI|nr:TIGR02680 family protein [Terrihalobacillus insolitus]MDC3414688.1 TIGR02680 family protein [Terrihalobacillus insolitus]MDC3424199.1 TIGR02680 family protein [Terrihalobacillus insolitus]
MMKADKWKMNRAGLLNFWYYDDEIFSFADGKLLLRGSNGSGKSVTMQSLLPVLLDGKKSPDRLDPFGSKARRMEDYLLGEKEIVNRDERTGYIFMEFKRAQTEQYLTIGIGLQAKRNKQMKFWGFVITDNRRIGHDFELYKNEQNLGEKQRIPRSRIELENAIGEGGHVVQTQTDYMKMVNKYLFGFESLDAYDDLIKLLIQLRSPKLSKDFKPTVIYEILEAALPPLSDDDLRHLSDTIEQMDQTKQQIEQLERELHAVEQLNRVYHTYNQRLLADQANELLQADKRVKKAEQRHQEIVTNQNDLKTTIAKLQGEIRELTQNKWTYEKQKERLQSHKVWNLESEKKEEQAKLHQLDLEKEKKDAQLEQRRRKEYALLEEKGTLEEKIDNEKETLEDQLLDMRNDAEESSFQQHTLNEQDFQRHHETNFDFSIWRKETQQYVKILEQIDLDFQKFDALKAKYQEKDKELASENKKLDDATHEKQQWSRLLEEDKEKKINEIFAWVEGSEWLTVKDDVLQEAARAIHSLYEPTSYESVVTPFRNVTMQFEQDQRQHISHQRFQLDQLKEQMESQEKQLAEWKTKKDPEPDMDPATKEARQQLLETGAAFVPFYAAVEFQDHVSPDIRKRLEAAIIDSRLLDALITPETISIQHDRLLVPNPNMMAHTLADYLKPDLELDGQVPASLVDEVLQSIMIADDETSTFSISESGQYQMGLIKGHAIPVEDVRFIGRNARKRYRLEQIAKIEAELQDLIVEKERVQTVIDSLEEAIKLAKNDLAQFPIDDDLRESFRHIEKLRVTIEQHNEHIQQLSEQTKMIYDDYQQVKRSIEEQTRPFSIEMSREAYWQAKETMKRYEKDLYALEAAHIKYVNALQRMQDIGARLQDIVEEVNEIQGELNVVHDRASQTKKNLEQIEMQLEKEGALDIRRQISEVQQMLESIGQDLKEKETSLPKKESDLTHGQTNLEEQQHQLDFWRNMRQVWHDSFEKELHYRFVINDESDLDISSRARDVMKEYGDLLKNKDSSQIAGQVTQEFYKQQSDLMEYRMRMFEAPSAVPSWMETVTDDNQAPFIEQWKQKVSRRVIELDYQGKKVSPYTVQQEVESEQTRQESLLDEQDQALYEEILFKSVGTKLRSRIRRAEQWAEKMNGLMESRDTSSGLSFSIKWKPRTADSDEEMDTVDLVRLLKQDAKLLKEEDLERITIHFRSKIAKAKEIMGNQYEVHTLLQVLKEVLDYRKWFSFVLSYRREGEPKRELTNNAFYKFSGGEKAMAMYIPLFTACYSRYQEADDAAPHIISLDEAFAGVDENNIREMFEVVEHLGFDYIMNSQVLWGDYDTISELAICELIRPKNADYVSVIRYHWDGNRIDFELPEESKATDVPV